jgi:hypothetical protein
MHRHRADALGRAQGTQLDRDSFFRALEPATPGQSDVDATVRVLPYKRP